MAWNLSGRGLEICSCKTFCPCWLTADVEPDEGWCSAVLAWDSTEGGSDGVDLAGIRPNTSRNSCPGTGRRPRPPTHWPHNSRSTMLPNITGQK